MPAGDGDGEGMAGFGEVTASGLEPHANANATTATRAQRLTGFLTAGVRGRFCRLPSWLELGDRDVDRVDEALDVVLAHRRRQRAHQTRRHQHPVVQEAEEEVTRLLFVGGRSEEHT